MIFWLGRGEGFHARVGSHERVSVFLCEHGGSGAEGKSASGDARSRKSPWRRRSVTAPRGRRESSRAKASSETRAAGRRPSLSARKAPLASLQEFFRPRVIQALSDALARAEFRNAVLVAQAVARCGFSPQPSIASASPGERPSPSAQTTISGFRISGSSSLLDGYDEPEILRSSTR